jgi:Na+/melibiose symporter-like transporter
MHGGPGHVLLVGALATGTMTTLMRASQELHYSRMDLPYLLGAALTPDRDRAKAVGFFVHFVNGLALSFLYSAFFALVPKNPGVGAAMGVAHAIFVLVVVLPIMPAFHPRMATETRGPDPTPLLEPPGFMGLNYGRRTPVLTILCHAVYGAILGAML